MASTGRSRLARIASVNDQMSFARHEADGPQHVGEISRVLASKARLETPGQGRPSPGRRPAAGGPAPCVSNVAVVTDGQGEEPSFEAAGSGGLACGTDLNLQTQDEVVYGRLSGGLADIPMVKTADFGQFHDLTHTRWVDRPWLGRLLTKRQMGSGPVVGWVGPPPCEMFATRPYFVAFGVWPLMVWPFNQGHTSSGVQVHGHEAEQLFGGVAHEL